jgi:hypothetical protein
MRDDELPERAREPSEAMEANRVWRETARKRMIESIELLLAQSQKLALSQYTRSAERSKWTRLAGQLIWWKDQILRAMTFEALEHDVHKMMRDMYEENQRQQRPTWKRIEWAPTIVKKRTQDEEVGNDSIDTVPEMMREEENVVDKASIDTNPLVPPVVKKKKEDQEDVTSSEPGSSSENPVA